MKSKSQKVYRCQNCHAVCQACFGRKDTGPRFDKLRSQTHKDLTKKIEPVKMDSLVQSIEDSDADLESLSDTDPINEEK